MTFSNNSSQKERRAVIKNDATTLHRFAQSEASDIGGRFAKPQTVNASEQAVHYPRLPTSSPWSCDPVPPEEPLGVDISEPPLVGEQWEIEKSLDQDFSVQRSLRDGAPPSVGFSSVPTASGLAPGSEVVRGRLAEEPGSREPLPLSGRHSTSRHRVSPNNIKRRLV
jgi:hypothetical protein